MSGVYWKCQKMPQDKDITVANSKNKKWVGEITILGLGSNYYLW
jgi:hypothetical protein